MTDGRSRDSAVVASRWSSTVVAAGRDRRARRRAAINGAGSTWSPIAIDQWRADVARQGISVNYQGDGSTRAGSSTTRTRVDFAVSEIPFTTAYRDATGHRHRPTRSQLAAHRPYAYMPIVAGGTSFMYHLDINGSGSRTCDCRPTTIAKIFTGVITNWNDPAITADNRGRALPEPAHQARRPLRRFRYDRAVHGVHGEPDPGYLDRVLPAGRASTSTRARRCRCSPPSTARSQQFSDGVAAFVAAPYNNGAITYVEYGYAKSAASPSRRCSTRPATTRSRSANASRSRCRARRSTPTSRRTWSGVYTNPDTACVPGVELQLPDRARPRPRSRSTRPRARR